MCMLIAFLQEKLFVIYQYQKAIMYRTRCIDMASSIFEKGISNRNPLPRGAHAVYRQVCRHFVITNQEFTASSTRCVDVRRVIIWRLIKAAMNTAVMISMIVGAGALSRKKLA